MSKFSECYDSVISLLDDITNICENDVFMVEKAINSAYNTKSISEEEFCILTDILNEVGIVMQG